MPLWDLGSICAIQKALYGWRQIANAGSKEFGFRYPSVALFQHVEVFRIEVEVRVIVSDHPPHFVQF